MAYDKDILLTIVPLRRGNSAPCRGKASCNGGQSKRRAPGFIIALKNGPHLIVGADEEEVLLQRITLDRCRVATGTREAGAGQGNRVAPWGISGLEQRLDRTVVCHEEHIR